MTPRSAPHEIVRAPSGGQNALRIAEVARVYARTGNTASRSGRAVST